MIYTRFDNERELIKAVFPQLERLITYPRVTHLAGVRIQPDIDILSLEKASENKNRIIGFEVKVLGSDKYGNVSWTEFYKGLGESLLYLRYGVERCGLIFGFRKGIKKDETIDEFIEKLMNDREKLSKIFGNHFYLGDFLYKGGYIRWIIEARNDFLQQERDFLEKCIKEGKLKYEQKLLKEIGEEKFKISLKYE